VSGLSAIATALTLLGTVLVGVGLYRRDPAAQRRLRRAWSGFSSRVLRRRQHASGGAASIVGVVGMSAEGMTPPLEAQPDAPLEKRVGRLEENIEILSGSIRSQAEARRKGDRELRERVDALAEALRGEISEVRRLADEASVPERMEWWGLALLATGAALGFVAG
jgi:hypothetical protein